MCIQRKPAFLAPSDSTHCLEGFEPWALHFSSVGLTIIKLWHTIKLAIRCHFGGLWVPSWYALGLLWLAEGKAVVIALERSIAVVGGKGQIQGFLINLLVDL